MRVRLHRSALRKEPADVNMLPMMNIIMLLIPFMILSAQFIKLGAINVTAPPIQDRPCSDCPPPNKKALRLTVSITQKGLLVHTRHGKMKGDCAYQKADQPAGLTFRKLDGKYDLRGLRRCLTRLKSAYPRENQMILMAEPAVPYKTVVSVMDATRETSKKKKLFPLVSVSAGVL